MIGNNACGSRALGYGRTSDNVVDLDVADLQRRAHPQRDGADESGGHAPWTGWSPTTWA